MKNLNTFSRFFIYFYFDCYYPCVHSLRSFLVFPCCFEVLESGYVYFTVIGFLFIFCLIKWGLKLDVEGVDTISVIFLGARDLGIPIASIALDCHSVQSTMQVRKAVEGTCSRDYGRPFNCNRRAKREPFLPCIPAFLHLPLTSRHQECTS